MKRGSRLLDPSSSLRSAASRVSFCNIYLLIFGFVIVPFCTLVFVFVYTFQALGSSHVPTTLDAPRPHEDAILFRSVVDFANSLKPTHETLEGVNIAWQLPADAVHMTGLLLFFHGCTHSAADWFRLPEEVRIVSYGLTNDFGALAFSSQMRHPPQCWDHSWPVSDNIDAPRVKKALSSFLVRQGLGFAVPLFAFGASSGGDFVSILMHTVSLRAAVIQISPGNPQALSAGGLDGLPISFLYMSRDTNWASKDAITPTAKSLQARGHPVHVQPIAPRVLTPSVMHERAPLSFSPQRSEAFFNATRALGALDPAGFLSRDPRASGLANTLFGQHTLGLKPDELPIVVEELNLLYGEHELSSEHFTLMLQWFTTLT